jgi:RuvA N terminal domain/Helix-hairpin-helix domain
MIGQLRGRLAEKRTNQVLVDVGGVGYLVQIPLSTFAALGELHAEVSLLIHTHVREDQLALYGFLTSREKQFFEMLLSVSGVGPSLALKILSGMSVEDVIPAAPRPTSSKPTCSRRCSISAMSAAMRSAPSKSFGTTAPPVPAQILRRCSAPPCSG